MTLAPTPRARRWCWRASPIGSRTRTARSRLKRWTRRRWRRCPGSPTVLLPFEHPEVAARYRAAPKHGVLLYGPPGTGKTSIGRALAHRLKGKMFMVKELNLHRELMVTFAAAEANAPSVVFIDDMDAVMQRDMVSYGHQADVFRFLLAKLDGLASRQADAKHVVVIMACNNLKMLPEPLLRSGRIELWLKTELPKLQARPATPAACHARCAPAPRRPHSASPAQPTGSQRDPQPLLERGRRAGGGRLDEGRQGVRRLHTCRPEARGDGQPEPPRGGASGAPGGRGGCVGRPRFVEPEWHRAAGCHRIDACRGVRAEEDEGRCRVLDPGDVLVNRAAVRWQRLSRCGKW
eukprot:6355054-Prymnesium_polylepis.1